jgi:hypothetical protein
LLPTALNRAWNLVFMVFVTQVMRCERVFLAIGNRIGFLYRVIFRAKGPRIAIDAFSSSRFLRGFAIGKITWGVNSQFHIFVSHCSSAFLRVIYLIVLVTRFTTVLHADPWSHITVFSALVRVLVVDLNRVDRYIDPKEWVCLSAACLLRRQRLWNRVLLCQLLH